MTGDVSEAASRTVLLVEDEALIRFLLAEEMVSRGVAVVEAATGEEAQRELKNGRRIDLVVTDMRMPGPVDGLALCRWMSEHSAGVPVLVTSGLDAGGAGAFGNPAVFRVVTKPYRPAEVAAEVAAFLSGAAISSV